MPPITDTETRPWVKAIKQRNGPRNRRGAMPPWYIEKEIGVQHQKGTIFDEDEMATIAKRAEERCSRR